MEIKVLRIGQRVVRDDRVTTHVALVSRAFGATKIFMNEVNPEIKDTLNKVNKTWGSSFEIEFIDSWKEVIRQKQKESYKLVHLTMYGQNVNEVKDQLQNEEKILVIVGAEKVPREVYEQADYNIAIGNQPHSEISALAVLLDRIQDGKQFSANYEDAQRKIIPTEQGKNVIVNKTRD